MGWKNVVASVGKISGSYTKVGVQEGAKHKPTLRDASESTAGEKAAHAASVKAGTGVTDLVTIAAVHEFGAPKRGIDQRSFLRSAFDEHRRELEQILAGEKSKLLVALVRRQNINGAIRLSLNRVGLLHTKHVQAKIRSNIPPPLAAATIERKGSSRTLIDSGQLVQSIRHVTVVNK